MTRSRLVPVALSLLLAGSALGGAQSLGDVAKREEEKKKKKAAKPPAPAKVYTEDDLKKARESDSAAVTVLPENGNESGNVSSPSLDDRSNGEEGPKRNEKYWRREAAERRDVVREAEARIKELEEKITALRSDLSPVNTQDPNRLQSRDRELREAMDSLDAARRELETKRKALADLEEEARRAGALPGWVR